MRPAICYSSLLCLLLLGSTCTAQVPIDRSVKLNGGLIGHVLKIGRSNSRNSIAATISIENAGKNTAYLIQVGPLTITDNVGNSAESHHSSGIGFCNASVDTAGIWCLGLMNPDNAVPLQVYTRIDPGKTITINVSFNSPSRHGGPTMAITMNVLARFVVDVDRDMQVPDGTKYRQFNMINIGFPSIPVQDE